MSFFFTFLKNFHIVDFKNIHFSFSSWNKTVLSFKNLFVKHLLLGKNMFLSSETPYPKSMGSSRILSVLILEKLNWNIPYVLILDPIYVPPKEKYLIN